MVTLKWHTCKYKVHKLRQRYIRPHQFIEDVPLVEFMYRACVRACVCAWGEGVRACVYVSASVCIRVVCIEF